MSLNNSLLLPPQRLGRGFLLTLGLLAIMGVGCATVTLQPPPDQRAKSQFLPPAEGGDAVAQYRLGLSYRYGSSGLPRDLAEARRWLGLAAEQGYKDAQVALGSLYLSGGPGLAADGGLALQWLTRAAEQGTPADQVWLAQLLEEGRPPALPADGKAARAWYERAAKRSTAARHGLGRLWEQGIGGAADGETALKWYLLAQAPADVARMTQRLRLQQVARARKAAEEWQP